MTVFLLGLAVLLGASRAADTVVPAQLGPPPLGFSSSVRSVCKPMPSTLSLCHGIGYRHMRVPNLLGHDSLREAQQQSVAWLPLVSKLCHRDTKKFLCSLFAPVCLPELSGPVSPCRSLCEAVRDGCVPVMSAFGFPWPEMFNCTRFPRGTELCIPATGEQEGRTAEEVKHEEALKGSVICDACSLAAEGETDIQENFCHSPYAFKMRLGSVSTVGGDRQLVPTARSRILRWAGGGAERAEGVGGAMAHSALWLQEGGTCTCPGLDSAGTNEDQGLEEEHVEKGQAKGGKEGNGAQGGWYLALAQAEEGRLVLTRLVRWTRGDKELKKFIRALLKQPCPVL
ncbi:putative secreted frizzled-related protein 2-like [Scophthalmus maximus]|uniref:Putative secreted frizzled-related protein 2-like n=1 Tax=Scophthalmus maximus TaxID=52904 RepID=A0A2U9B5N2_SCOMX|nr:secreted frizzled-related protein 2-like [Scophthalmus maximus]AWO99145.1 putative secreted frizzled-related protein 2-like [Scophthalmus maximus]